MKARPMTRLTTPDMGGRTVDTWGGAGRPLPHRGPDRAGPGGECRWAAVKKWLPEGQTGFLRVLASGVSGCLGAFNLKIWRSHNAKIIFP